MTDFLKALSGMGLDAMFVLAGLVFLFLAVVGNISGKIQTGQQARVVSALLGPVLIGLGLWINLGRLKSTANTQQTQDPSASQPQQSQKGDGSPGIRNTPESPQVNPSKNITDSAATTETVPPKHKPAGVGAKLGSLAGRRKPIDGKTTP